MIGVWGRLSSHLRKEKHGAAAPVEPIAQISLTRQEYLLKRLKEELRDLPKPLIAVFATRAAFCALPFLAEPSNAEFLSFWKETDRDRQLREILRTVQFAAGAASLNRKIQGGTAAANAAAQAANAINAGNAAFHAAYATVFAANSDTVEAAYYTAYYAAKAATADGKTSGDDLLSFLREELHAARANPNPWTYLARPLSAVIEPQARLFIDRLRKHGSGFDWWADWYEDRLQGRRLNLRVLEESLSPPASVTEQGTAAVNAYLKSLAQGDATRPLNRIRAIFIGYGESGKTSLIRALHGETVEIGKEEMTAGIVIRDWLVPDTEIKAHFWDFGGQVMAHATHQFFLRESCVYVLVMEPRAEINANQQAQYWLEHVRLFGKDAPVLLVGNKSDLPLDLHLDMNTLKDSYPNIVGFFPLSCTGYQSEYRPQFEIFHATLVKTLRQASTHQLLFTPRHFGVLEDLRNRPQDQAFLKKQEFDKLCEQHKVEATEDLNPDWLLDLLDKLGVVVHFPDIAWLGAYVLNPRWLTYGVYTLLYSDEARKAAGQLAQSQVIAILGRGRCQDNQGSRLEFPAIECRFILDAMKQFELCYALPGAAETLILPDLLPSDRPDDLGLDKNQALAFDFDFEALLPRHLMTGFIVRRHGEIFAKQVWQNGVHLHSHHWQAEALVQADHHRRRLSLWVVGKEAARYFTTLHDEFMLMLERMKMRPPQFQEWVVLPGAVFAPGTEPPRADFRDLLALEASGKTEYVCKYGQFKLSEVLKIMPKDERDKQSRTIIFNAPAAYNEGGTMTETIIGNKIVTQERVKALDDKLAALHYDLDVQVDDAALRGAALRELEKIRAALQAVQTGDEPQKRSAMQTLSRFGDHLKEGTSGIVKALKTIKDGGDSITWLADKAPIIIAEMARWLV